MSIITNQVSNFKKRNTQRQYLRNGDLKVSDGGKHKWVKDEIDVDTTFSGNFTLTSGGILQYIGGGQMLDLYQYIFIDSTPEYLIGKVPTRLTDKISFTLDSDGNFIINI